MTKEIIGIEEVMETASCIDMDDIRSAFLFLKKSTGQLFTQLHCEKKTRPDLYSDQDIVYCGPLTEETTQEDILYMARSARRQTAPVKLTKQDKEHLAWLESHDFFKKEG